MKKLYHGSKYKNDLLKPGFSYTNKEVHWDDTESNKSLYATEDKDSAIIMAIAGLLERENSVKKFTITNKVIGVEFYPNEPRPVITKTDVIYIYTIKPLPNQDWVKVNNKNNVGFSEFKTNQDIQYDKVVAVNVMDWLKANGYAINYLN